MKNRLIENCYVYRITHRIVKNFDNSFFHKYIMHVLLPNNELINIEIDTTSEAPDWLNKWEYSKEQGLYCTVHEETGFLYKEYTFIKWSVKEEKTEKLIDEKLREMMKDPKYWKEHDPEYVKMIEEGFKKLYS